jgi:hypothetical protein
MRIPLAGMLVAAVVMGVVRPAAAEDRMAAAPGVFSPGRLAPIVRQSVEAQPMRPQAQAASAQPRRQDSILNGGLIGAAIGAVGGSALMVASRGGSDNIPRAMLNVAVWPAFGGFAVGAMIDALH